MVWVLGFTLSDIKLLAVTPHSGSIRAFRLGHRQLQFLQGARRDQSDADTKVSGLRHGASCCWGIAGISRRQRWQAQAFMCFMLNIRLAIVHMY